MNCWIAMLTALFAAATAGRGFAAETSPARPKEATWPPTPARPETKAADKPEPVKSLPAARETRTIAGWTVQVSRDLLATNTDATSLALKLLAAQLEEIVRVVSPSSLAKLQQVPLWFSPEYPGVKPHAEFHPDVGWLRKNSRDPAMAKAVEFTNIRIFEAETRRMPNFALHELAHAYHDRFLPDGFDNAEIKAAYENAKASGKYDHVERQDSEGHKRMDRAYALTDPQEYFAETTEAFFSRNDFFPYTRDQLKQTDPVGFALMEKLWGQEQPNKQ